MKLKFKLVNQLIGIEFNFHLILDKTSTVFEALTRYKP